MPDPHTVHLDPGLPVQECWREVAAEAARWCAQHQIAWRDAVVIVPFAQLIEPARRAFAAAGGWQPRIETTDTWAASLGPPPEQVPGALTGSATLDGLTAAQLLRRQPALTRWETEDPRAFFQAVGATVSTAQALQRAAHAREPAARPAFWSEAEGACVVSGPGPGALELSLARLALEWARHSPAPATDRLFGTKAGALIWVDAAGADPLVAAVAAQSGRPSLRIDADPAIAQVFEGAVRVRAPAKIVADGLEGEARAVAAEVIGWLNEGQRPLALIALDRALVRRVRALLDRRGVVISDETGWALSTTRAAACVMAPLVAGADGAARDDALAWLKSLPAHLASPGALAQLEQAWRAGRPVTPDTAPAASALWAWARGCIAPLQSQRSRSLQVWLRALAQVLGDTGVSAALAADVAGRQVLAALHLADAEPSGSAVAHALRGEVADAPGFRAWVDRTLERATFVLPAVAEPDVVLTPLPRATLRAFAAVVVGGADDRSLLAPARYDGLLPEACARALGLPTPSETQARERLALAQLLRLPRITFIHRRLDGTEPVAGSPALDAMALVRRRAGQPAWDERAPASVEQFVAVAPVLQPSPEAPYDLPPRLSASTLESLRACPYRFFARSVLRLREAEELEDGVDKRDYGNWLHAVLDRFHRARPASPQDDAAALRRIADEVTAEQDLSDARLLPFRIGFEGLAPAYLDWLYARERTGLRWSEGECDVERHPPELEGMTLFGRIDRIDRDTSRTSVIDYKTGSVARLQAQLRNPLEDTQLAFYALLLQAEGAAAGSFDALYLALDDPKAPRELAHERVGATARTLLEGLAGDLQRLRAGAGLPALGEGSVCDHCEARGLCRRDHWSPGP